MKKSISKTIILGFGVIIINIGTLCGQTLVTRYTPEGSDVRCYNQITEMENDDKEDWSVWVDYHFPQATELNSPSASYTYNCHAYAWHIYNGGDNVWIGYYYDQQADEDVYWTDGSYIRQSSEAGADKISYYSGNHSAIQTSTQGIYKSKWGPGPLMQHARNYGPPEYCMGDRNYYDRPSISGDGLFCYTGSYTYSVQDFVGVTYSWTTSSHLQINGSSTGRTVSVSPTSISNMLEWVKVEIYITAYDETVENTKSIQVGSPALDYISGPEDAPIGFQHSYFSNPAEDYRAEASYSWYVEPSDGVSIDPFYENAGITFDDAGNYRISAEATNSCGTSSTYLDVYIYDWPRYALSPNPASEEVTITVSKNESNKLEKNQDPKYVVSIYNIYGVLQKESSNTGESFSIPVNNLMDGNYIVKIRNGKNISSHKLVIKR